MRERFSAATEALDVDDSDVLDSLTEPLSESREERGNSRKGTLTYDVRIEGGGKVTKYVANRTDRFREMRSKGEGVRNQESFAYFICECP